LKITILYKKLVMGNNNTHQLITRNSGYIQNQVKDPPSAEIFIF
jgi:hypothetical protein